MKQMKRAAHFLLCLVMAFPLHGQNAMHDALILREYCGETTQNGMVRAILKDDKALAEDDSGNQVLNWKLAELLAPYVGVAPESLTQASINATFSGDPFVRIALTSMSGIGIGGGEEANMFLQPSGGNPVSSIVDGIARFLVKRTKAELSLAFFEDFKKEVEQDQYLQYFFPVTRQMLLGIDTEVYQFQIYMDALRDAFISDLKVLPGSVEGYLRENPANIMKPAMQCVCIDFFHVIQSFMDKAAPQDIIKYCADPIQSEIQAKAAQFADLQDVAAGFQLVNLFSQSLLNVGEGKWYSGREINAAFADPVTFNIFMGLLWQQSRRIQVTFRNGLKIEDLIAKAATAGSLMSSWRDEFTRFGHAGSEWENTLSLRPATEDQSKKEMQIPLLDNFYRTLQLFSRLMESANTVYQLINPDQIAPISPDQIKLVQQIGGLTFNISRAHYSAGVGNAAAILDIALASKFKGKRDFLRYGSFIGAVADAENAQEVENALDMFALPPGSSKAKKGAGKFSIALNAYTGVAAGAERFSYSTTSYGVSSIAAPLGFSLNWGQNWGKQPGCVGLFVPVIDVGAVFAYRFNDKDKIDNLPPMSWKNILAPGLYFVVDPPLGKWPISLGFGGQYGPLLRRVSDRGTYESFEVNAFRIGGFLTIDIPVTFLKLQGK